MDLFPSSLYFYLPSCSPSHASVRSTLAQSPALLFPSLWSLHLGIYIFLSQPLLKCSSLFNFHHFSRSSLLLFRSQLVRTCFQEMVLVCQESFCGYSFWRSSSVSSFWCTFEVACLASHAFFDDSSHRLNDSPLHEATTRKTFDVASALIWTCFKKFGNPSWPSIFHCSTRNVRIWKTRLFKELESALSKRNLPKLWSRKVCKLWNMQSTSIKRFDQIFQERNLNFRFQSMHNLARICLPFEIFESEFEFRILESECGGSGSNAQGVVADESSVNKQWWSCESQYRDVYCLLV